MGRHKKIREEDEAEDTMETETSEVDALIKELEALKAENEELKKRLGSVEVPEVEDTMVYHEAEAPKGKCVTARCARELYEKGWHDTPAKFKR